MPYPSCLGLPWTARPGRIRAVALLLALAVAAGTGHASAETRYALVVGNAQYAAVPSLRNPVADARAMRRQLEAAGFSVTYREDADRRAMNRAVDEFVGKLSTDSVAVFYYAGHGVQIGSANYLIPTDIRADTAGDVADDALDLGRVLERVTAAQARFALAIIDACRDNPFAAATGRALGTSRGLAPTTTANGVMVVYSAGANQTALDRLSDRDTNPNGVFTREWLQAMGLPGIPVQAVATQVRQSVASLARSVGHVQVPAVYDQSLGTFEFVPASSQAPSAPGRAQAQDGPPAPAPGFALAPAPAPALAIPAAPKPAPPALAPPSYGKPPALASAPTLPGGPPPAQDCDRLAQPLRRSMGRVSAYADGISRDALDVFAARAACSRAMRDWPDEPRFVAFAARAADKGGDAPEAVRLYRIAAQRGSATAQFDLAVSIMGGEMGLARDEREAAWLYRMAADQGYPPAQVNLGDLYRRGAGGVPHDDREAVRLWRAAAALGNADAQTNLGIMYAGGHGVAQNSAEAVRMFRLAAAQGDERAQKFLRSLGFSR